MPNYLKFGKRIIEGLELPETGKRATYHDTLQEGLSLRVTHTGAKTFIVRCRIEGTPEYKTLGKFPSLTVENARKAAQTFLSRVARGENPAQERREKKAELTLDEAFTVFMDEHVHAKRAASTAREYQRIYDTRITQLGGKKIGSLRYPDVKALHSRIGRNNGHYIANRVVSLLRSLYGWLLKERRYSGENPAWGIEPFKETPRDRFLTPEELPRFFNSLAAEQNQDIRDYVLLSLLTGARRQNVLAMAWAELDLSRKVWRIPMTKNQEPVTVPLIPAAMEILNARKEKSECEWVFGGNSKSGHMTDPKHGWERILARAGIEGLRIHDLRRSMGSWQAINQTSLVVIAKSLGQKSTQAAAIYSRLSLDPVRESMEQAARSMWAFQNTSEDSSVTPIKKNKGQQ